MILLFLFCLPGFLIVRAMLAGSNKTVARQTAKLLNVQDYYRHLDGKPTLKNYDTFYLTLEDKPLVGERFNFQSQKWEPSYGE